MDEVSLVTMWSKLKESVEALELDVVKNDRGNAAAGVRFRRGMRLVKKQAQDLVRTSVALSKAQRSQK